MSTILRNIVNNAFDLTAEQAAAAHRELDTLVADAPALLQALQRVTELERELAAARSHIADLRQMVAVLDEMHARAQGGAL